MIYSAVQCTKVAIQLIGQLKGDSSNSNFVRLNFYLVDDPGILTIYNTGQYSTVVGLVKIFIAG